MSDITTTVNGLNSGHAVISPGCRMGRGTVEAFDEAARRLKATYEQYAGTEANEQANWHLVLTVERP